MLNPMLWFFLSLIVIVHLSGVALFANLLLSRKRTSAMLLWTVWLLLLPVLGIPLYLLLGTDRIRRKRLHLHGEAARLRAEASRQARDNGKDLPELLTITSRLEANSLCSMGQPEIFPQARDYYDSLIEDIQAAEEYIHFQTFVFRQDEVGERFLEALVQAAGRGVNVRLLVDELGSPDTKEKFFRPLVEAGGEFSWCLTIHPRRNRYFFNLRNHRKIQIIDSRVAYVGGMNIGLEYEGRIEEIGPWEDMQLRVGGPVINELQYTFMDDWYFATQKSIEGDFYIGKFPDAGSIPVTVLRTGPDSLEQSFLKSFIYFCNKAERRLDLFTPYFAPDEAMLLAIQMTATRGVKVRLMIPTLNEHKYMVDIGRSFYEHLLEAGIEIHELPDAVNHAKVFIADDDWVMLGSPNLDMRSIRLNFEVGLLFKDRETTGNLDAHYRGLFERSSRVSLDEFRNRPFKEKLKQGWVRLFTPIL